MKTIYLLRHFKVIDNQSKKLNSSKFNKWVETYDNCHLKYENIVLPKVEKVFVSSQNRAMKTARYFNLDFEEDSLLKEVETKAFFETKWKFSRIFWLFISRIFWFLNLNILENRNDTKNRAQEFINKLKKDNSNTVLIISHGLFLKVLSKELEKIGYNSNIDFNIKNAKIYKVTKS